MSEPSKLPADSGLPAVYLQLLMEVLEDQGVDWRALLTEAGIDPACLSMEDVRLPMVSVRRLLESAVAASGEPGLGLKLALRMRLPMHGSLGMAVMSSQTLREAINLAQRYLRLRTPLLDLTVREEGDRVHLVFTPLVGLGPMHGPLLDAVTVGVATVGGYLLGRPVPEAVIRRRGKAPAYVERLKDQVPTTLVYGDEEDALTFPRHYLDAPLQYSDSLVARLSKEQCERTLERLSRSASFHERVSRVVETSHPFPPKLGRVAGMLFVSDRTLKRRLNEEGATYQGVVDEVRLRRAKDLLANTEMSLGQISEALGYADAANFTRAFRRWTGCNPSNYRLQAQQPPSEAMTAS
ncbi:AraC family transcriptional regulator [Marinobacteraceae bacterium S3BR75-40.1]